VLNRQTVHAFSIFFNASWPSSSHWALHLRGASPLSYGGGNTTSKQTAFHRTHFLVPMNF